jgi:hypothetical protein
MHRNLAAQRRGRPRKVSAEDNQCTLVFERSLAIDEHFEGEPQTDALTLGSLPQCVGEMIFCVHEPQYAAQDRSATTYRVQNSISDTLSVCPGFPFPGFLFPGFPRVFHGYVLDSV